MADKTVTDFKQACDEPLEVRILNHSEWRTGTKEQLQSIGIGVGVAFPGEPGARPRIVTARDSRGWIVKIRRDHFYRNGNRIFTGRYEAKSIIPDAIILEREAPERRKLEIYSGKDKAKLKGVDGVRALLAAMAIENFELGEESAFSEQDFRKNLADMLILGSNFHLAEASTPSAKSPFYFGDEAATRIKHHFAAIEEIIHSAPVKRNPEGQRLARLEMYNILELEPPPTLKTSLKKALYVVK